jgi:hypothetical protein
VGVALCGKKARKIATFGSPSIRNSGSCEPVADHNAEAWRARNRRIEINLMERAARQGPGLCDNPNRDPCQ